MRTTDFAITVLGAVVFGFVPPAGAQGFAPTQAYVPLNFAPPGARSLAMGATFVGLADDATASESNPAGLTILTKPEVSAHARGSRFETEFPNTLSGVGTASFGNNVYSPSFFSLVYPFKAMAVSAYYARTADYANSSSYGSIDPETAFGAKDTTDIMFRAENVGMSVACKLGSRVSVGASVRATRLKLTSTLISYFVIGSFFPGGGVGDLSFGSTISSSSTKVTWNAGALLHPWEWISIGAVFKKGAAFDEDMSFFDPGASQDHPFPHAFTHVASSTVTRIPDTYGVGIAVKPTDRWTILLDMNRINYSVISSDGTFFAQEGESNGAQLECSGGLYNDLHDNCNGEVIRDSTEVHVGTEYVFKTGRNTLVALRAGMFTDPDHDGLKDVNSKQVHATIGGGLVFSERVQVDVAANLAKTIREGLVSVVYRFK